MQFGIESRWQVAHKCLADLIRDCFLKIFNSWRARVQKLKGVCQYTVLKIGVVGFTQRSSQREITEQAAGRRSIVDLLPNRAEGDRCDPCCLKNMCQRTDRTRAQRSDRCQENNVHFMIDQAFGCGGAAIHFYPRQVELIACDGEVNLRHSPDLACGGQFFQPVDGIDYVEVHGDAAGIKIW